MRTQAFIDEQCTCSCGNKHELYGGMGYTGLQCQGATLGDVDSGFYYNETKCNKCGKVHQLYIGKERGYNA